MTNKKIILHQGDWFGVPLDRKPYVIGKLARCGTGGSVLCYFFPRVVDHAPSCDDVRGLRNHDSNLVLICGRRFLVSGRWPIGCTPAGFERSEWPVPMFGSKDPLVDDLYFGQEYDDNLVLGARIAVSKERFDRLRPMFSVNPFGAEAAVRQMAARIVGD